ncbi:MAG: molybdate ABC transporter permease subunit [Planctomycetaceae bacterium]
MDWQAILLTLQLATSTTAILFVVGLPLAYWLTTTVWRGKFLLESFVMLPLVLPPTVLGFYLLLALGPNSPLGQFYERITGGHLPFSFSGILLGSVIGNLPFAIRPFVAAFSSLDRRLVEASWCLGVSRFETFRLVSLPLCWPGILAGIVLTFAHAVGEFGVVLMLGGNIPGITRTISVSIYDDVQALNYVAASRTSAVLILFSFTVLSLTHLLQRRRTSA